ncbi:MAG: hypothetical protein EON59_08090 [Alphaproteobacteria bacterium]|nr:MAG: hypothetical protein EON59_08090 [Alphaproteobacteria bacterium]
MTGITDGPVAGYPNSPKLIKVAIISIPAGVPVPSVIVLQYNPERLSRTIAPKYVQTGGIALGDEMLAGPSEETIRLTARINAVDQLAASGAVAGEFGIYPQIAELEICMFPHNTTTLSNADKITLGLLEIVPSEMPLTLLVWGSKRVVPVQLTGYSVTETMHDPNLNPVTADVSLTFKVLTYQECAATQPDYIVSIANLLSRASLPALNLADSAGGAGRY